MQTASVFVVLPATLFAKCCPVQGLLYGHIPSHPPAPNPPLSKREQRRPASFQFALMPPFKGYRKRNRVTDLNHRGSHSCLQPGQAGCVTRWVSPVRPALGDCPVMLRAMASGVCSAPRRPAACFLQGQLPQFTSAALTFPQILWS